ncbi:MAG: hypothetical protein J2P17_21760, partial [Mycobacterium sp.]|nr:hypothetical protein [Mycobacterium sp.]
MNARTLARGAGVAATVTALGASVLALSSPAAATSTTVARFSWSLAELHADAHGAVVESNFDTNNESTTSPVLLKGCASTGNGGIRSYRWTFSNGDPAITRSTCQATWNRPLSADLTQTRVTLTVTPVNGRPASVTEPVRYRDRVIASLGDSAASGEGAPQAGSPMWAAKYCGRSGWAASAQAALHAQANLNDTTVHFWDLACAGASITSADSQEWWTKQYPDATYWGGMVDPYRGTYSGDFLPPHVTYLPPQIDRLQTLQRQTGLPVERLLMTVGANDTHWAVVIEKCLPKLLASDQKHCINQNAARMTRAVGRLSAHLDTLHNYILKTLSPTVPPNHIYLTGYFDPLDSLSPQPAVCVGETLAGYYLRTWAVSHVEDPLQDAVHTAATTYNWHYVDGIRQAFQGHGVCHTNRLINSVSDSVVMQHDEKGSWHANRAGQLVIAKIIEPQIEPGLAIDTHGMGPLGSAPGVAVSTAGHEYVFWRGTDNSLREAWWDGFIWNGPTTIPGTSGSVGSAPSVAVSTAGHEYVFWQGTDNSLREAWWDGTRWNGPATIPGTTGTLGSAPSVAVSPTGGQFAFWQGSDNALKEAWWDGTRWNGPATIPGTTGTLGSAPSVAV